MLTVRGLTAGYGRVQVLWGVDLEVGRNQIVALLGPNGAGKTTLLRAVSGLVRPWAGTARFAGNDVVGLEVEDLASRGLAHVPEGRRLFAGLTVRENLLLGGWRRRDRELDPVLELFPSLRRLLDRPAGGLSGGEQQMCAIGRGMMSRPGLIMIDELSLGLAPKTVEEILARLPDVAAAGTSVLLVEQDVDAALSVAEYSYVLDGGRVVASGLSGAVLLSPHVRAAYLGAEGIKGID